MLEVRTTYAISSSLASRGTPLRRAQALQHPSHDQSQFGRRAELSCGVRVGQEVKNNSLDRNGKKNEKARVEQFFSKNAVRKKRYALDTGLTVKLD